MCQSRYLTEEADGYSFINSLMRAGSTEIKDYRLGLGLENSNGIIFFSSAWVDYYITNTWPFEIH